MLRELRLRALQTEPSAYGSSYEYESPFPIEQWRQRIATPHFVAEGNVAAERLYERLGFSRAGHVHIRERDGVAEIEMALDLT